MLNKYVTYMVVIENPETKLNEVAAIARIPLLSICLRSRYKRESIYIIITTNSSFVPAPIVPEHEMLVMEPDTVTHMGPQVPVVAPVQAILITN